MFARFMNEEEGFCFVISSCDLADHFLWAGAKTRSTKSHETARKEPLQGKLKDGYVRRY
jgi:hypothetical protein